VTHTYRELMIGGVFVAPIASYAAAMLFIIVMLRPILHFIGFSRLFSNPPIAELSLYLAIFGLLTLLF
jgi:Protein of unknown function (DUF1656)